MNIALIMGAAWTISGILWILIFKKKNAEDSSKGLAILVNTIFLFSIMDNLLHPGDLPRELLNTIFRLTRLSYFLIGPALFFYVKSLTGAKSPFKLIQALHTLPFLLWFLYTFLDPRSIHPEVHLDEALPLTPGLPRLSISFARDLTLNISRLTYSILSLLTIRDHREALPQVVSHYHRENTLSWLRWLIISYASFYFIGLSSQLIFPRAATIAVLIAAGVRFIPPVLFASVFSLFSGRQYKTIDTVIPKEYSSVGANLKKYRKSGLSDEECKRLFEDLVKYIVTQKAYLDPELTLEVLADQVQYSRHNLSEVINRGSGEKFYSFINQFRLDHFRQSVIEKTYPNYTILAIAMESGFRSSSAFYSLFKKKYNQAPRDFIKERSS